MAHARISVLAHVLLLCWAAATCHAAGGAAPTSATLTGRIAIFQAGALSRQQWESAAPSFRDAVIAALKSVAPAADKPATSVVLTVTDAAGVKLYNGRLLGTADTGPQRALGAAAGSYTVTFTLPGVPTSAIAALAAADAQALGTLAQRAVADGLSKSTAVDQATKTALSGASFSMAADPPSGGYDDSGCGTGCLAGALVGMLGGVLLLVWFSIWMASRKTGKPMPLWANPCALCANIFVIPPTEGAAAAAAKHPAPPPARAH